MDFSQPYVAIAFFALLLVVAFIYASVGHGGASGYLALMALFAFPMIVMKPSALLLNIFVAGISFWFFKKNHYFRWKLFYPFAITSIPAAFLGGSLSVNPILYKQILGIFLIIAILRMLTSFGSRNKRKTTPNLWLALAIGLVIGLFSGMIGIGGGIILSPVIILLGWGNIKEAAAVSALFIVVNSISGIVGFTAYGGSIPVEALYLVPVAVIGGALGAFNGSRKFNTKTLTYLLSAVLLIASIKLYLV